MIVDGQHIEMDISEKFDVCVIGSGAGGAVVAKEMSEKGYSVVLLDQGGNHPPSSHRDLSASAVRRMYGNSGLFSGIGNPNIFLPYGECLGGTTVINSGTCFRTPSSIFEKWNKEFNLNSLNENEFIPLFEKIEKEINVMDMPFEHMSKINLKLHETLVKKGIPGKPLKRNIVDCEGLGMCCFGCTKGAKQSMEVTYIPKAIRAGAKVYTHCKVVEITKTGRKITGVKAKFLKNKNPSSYSLSIEAKITIVSGGTIFTPILLKKNGLGNKKHLGKHLTIHPTTKVFAEYDEDINGWEGTPQAYYIDIFQKQGIMFEGVFIPPDMISFLMPFSGKKLHTFMKNYRKMQSFGLLISDSQTGTIRNLPLLGPTVFYSLSPEDVVRLKKGITFLARLFLEAGAKKIYPMVHYHKSTLLSEEDIIEFENANIPAKDFDCAAFHLLGTARMAAKPQDGVVDQNSKLFNYDNLYISDGSIVPSSLGVNPQITIMAFSHRLADHLTTQIL